MERNGSWNIIGNVKERAIRGLLARISTQRVLTAQLDLTNACNLSCAHCYHPHHSNKGALGLGQWKLVLDQYDALTRKLYLEPRFVLCGGEPTISPLFLPVVRELSKRWPGVRVTVLTNGTRLTPSLLAAMSGLRLDFQISLDGPDEARHDLIRGPEAFSQAMTGLRNLQEAGFNACFLATLSWRTSFWIEDFFEMALGAGVTEMNFTRFISQGAGRGLEERGEDRTLTAPELRHALKRIVRCSRTTGVLTDTNKPLYHLIDPRLGANGKFGFQGLVIDYKGNLKVTSRADFALGNVLESGLEELFLRHPLMNSLRDREIDGCGSCEHYDVCGGDRNAAFAATGSFLTKDPGCWLDAPGSMSQEVG